VYISKFRLRNFKSFADTGQIELRPGFNLVIGANNVGKSALVETLVPNEFISPSATSPPSSRCCASSAIAAAEPGNIGQRSLLLDTAPTPRSARFRTTSPAIALAAATR
jgi:hypothetical protein